MTARWAYTAKPERAQWPKIRATLVPFDGVRDALPRGVRKVSEDERMAQIRVRQRHVQRRYRAF
jgi:hypothetical protein